MNFKRSRLSFESQTKKTKTIHENKEDNTCLHETLFQSGLTLKNPPEKCIAYRETIHIVRSLRKNLESHVNYPRNLLDFLMDVDRNCRDLNIFKHYLFPNIVRITGDSHEEHPTNDSVFKILLNVPILQDKLTKCIFNKAIDLAADSKCGSWIQMILKCFSSVDNITNTDNLSKQLINLIDVASEKMVKLEIITAIPDIIGDQEHSDVAAKMCEILSEDHDLIPAILDCVSYLCLSDEQYEEFQRKSLNILGSLSRCAHFPNFVKFLLIPGRMSDTAYLETIHGLRNALGWSTSAAKPEDIASSQVLTATAIRTSMLSSKVIAGYWMKVVSSCKVKTDHKPIDFIILLILSSISEEKQKQVVMVIKKQIKLDILKEELMDECFQKFKPILKHYLRHLISLNNCILKTKGDPVIESYGSHIYTLMLSELEDCCFNIVAELLQLGLDCKQCVLSILLILNNVASKDMSLLKPQSLQMLTLLDRMDDMNIVEIRAVMDLLCGLAYTSENSVIRDDIHMIIRKELGSSSPKIKIQGILAGTHAIKYLIVSSNNDSTEEFPDDISYDSGHHLPEGDIREAAQIIELISRSTRQFPDMIAFFYDELSKIIVTATSINKQFLAWLTDAVTNDLQQNFIVDTVEPDRVAGLKLSMQYCINAESEINDVIAINIGPLAMESKNEIDVAILSPLFQLVQTLHAKKDSGNLSNIDALLGCAIVMPQYDVDLIEDMEPTAVSNILDCLIHCINWFRELLNAFSIQDDEALRTKILNRLSQIEEIEIIIGQILLKSKISYKPPGCIFNINKYTGEQIEKKPMKTQAVKQKNKNKADETVIPETSQATQNQNSVKSKLDSLHNIPLRSLSLNLLHILKIDLTSDEEESKLTIKTLKFLLKCVNNNLESVLISKIKRKTFLSKPDDGFSYEPKKAEECAKLVSEILPKVAEHLTFITSKLNSKLPENEDEIEFIITSEILDLISNLELIYNFYTIYFKWIGFRNHHNELLKSSLKSILPNVGTNGLSLKELVIAVAEYFKNHRKYCLQFSTAVALLDLIQSVKEYSDNTTILKILREISQSFLSEQWKTPDGVPEKGSIFNQSLDKFLSTYFHSNEILALKKLALQLANDVKLLKDRNSVLNSFKSISKKNFTILYRNFGTAVHGATKAQLNKGLSNSEHLDLWKDVAVILKHMSDITKTLTHRNNLSEFFKKSLPILKLFMSQGIPILEIQLKTETEEVLEILKILQQSTRFLQSLCCHSRLKKDTVLMSKVPSMRELLETLIYKVKAALAANNCSEAFWMGNLKNKDIDGEIIATQQSIESEDSVEDRDEQLPEDYNSDATDSETEMNPDSKSISDIV